LNLDKSSITSFSTIADEGVELLGSFVGSEAGRRGFLTEKVRQTTEHIRSLRVLNYHDALLLFKSCINPELIHLARCLDSSGLEDVWQSLDQIGLEFINFITGLSDQPSLDTQVSQVRIYLIYLPTKMGGLGITKYMDTYTAARQGFINASADFLTSLNIPHYLSFNDNRLNGDYITQNSAMLELHSLNRAALFEQLSTFTSRSTAFDRDNDIANAWLHLLPESKSTTFTDSEISLALSKLQLLLPPDGPTCNYCSQPLDFNHEESCEQIHHVRIHRHNAVRNLIYRTMKNLQKMHGTRRIAPISLEQPVNDMDTTQRRIDIRIAGRNYSNLYGLDMDVTVSALTMKKLAKIEDEHPSIVDRVMAAVNDPIPDVSDHLLKKRENKKFHKYRDARFTLKPLVITTGGSMNAHFKDLITNGLQEHGTSFKRQLSALLIKYNAMLYPLRVTNYG
jgi:hypothetical protein